MEPVADRVKKIIVDQLGVEEDLVTPEASPSPFTSRGAVPPRDHRKVAGGSEDCQYQDLERDRHIIPPEPTIRALPRRTAMTRTTAFACVFAAAVVRRFAVVASATPGAPAPDCPLS